jgi:hypothetical protein
MRLVIEREQATAAGNVPGKLYVDGVFYAYTLENNAYKIPVGDFPIYTRFSPKLLANKVAIEVPGRQYIMFHGGNDATVSSVGCVLTARNRLNLDYIQGDKSAELYELVSARMAQGDAARVTVKKKTRWYYVAAAVLAAYIIIK